MPPPTMTTMTTTRATYHQLYCLVTDAYVCVNNVPKVVTCQWNRRESNSRPLESKANALTITQPPGPVCSDATFREILSARKCCGNSKETSSKNFTESRGKISEIRHIPHSKLSSTYVETPKNKRFNILLIAFSPLTLLVGQQEGHPDAVMFTCLRKVQIFTWPSCCHCHSLSLAAVNPH